MGGVSRACAGYYGNMSRTALRNRRSGLSLLEVLIVIAVLATTLGLGATLFRAPSSQVYASSLRNLVLQARFEAIRRNEPVVVAWDADVQEFVVRASGSGAWCTSMGAELNRSNAADIGRLTVTTSVTGDGSLVWVPSGQARSCSGAAFARSFADIDDGRMVRRVVIGTAGRVEVE